MSPEPGGGLPRPRRHVGVPQHRVDVGSFNELSAAAGVKINLFGRLLLDLNLLMPLDSAGLRDKVSPLMGIEYAF